MKIELIVGPNGNDIPAQKVRVVYEAIDTEDGPELIKVEFKEAEFGTPKKPALYVNHYETCPHAGEFSRQARKNRKRQERKLPNGQES
jgi:hypothetical protein